jgi:uncharacterized protein VirK/YbjX
MTTRYLRTYISRSLTHGERRDIVISQAEHLREHLHRSFLLELEQPRRPLWRSTDERCSIWLSGDVKRYLEGDFVMTFKFDGIAIYNLSFSIGPNWADRAAGGVAMLVGRVQGERGRRDDIRLAAKALQGVSPAALLVSAAEGIALALKLSHIWGVAGSEQLCRSKPGAEYFDYDSFWDSLSGRRIDGWYQFDAPFADKPPSQTPARHRRRARKRRLLKDAIREEVRSAFVGRFARQNALSRTFVPTLSWARLTHQWVLPGVSLLAIFAAPTLYWFWQDDLIPDQTRYGRVDDVAVAFACAFLGVRVVTAWRASLRRDSAL